MPNFCLCRTVRPTNTLTVQQRKLSMNPHIILWSIQKPLYVTASTFHIPYGGLLDSYSIHQLLEQLKYAQMAASFNWKKPMVLRSKNNCDAKNVPNADFQWWIICLHQSPPTMLSFSSLSSSSWQIHNCSGLRHTWHVRTESWWCCCGCLCNTLIQHNDMNHTLWYKVLLPESCKQGSISCQLSTCNPM